MAIIKTRPSVQLLAPKVVHPGASFVATIVLDAKRAVAIDRLQVSLKVVDELRVGKRSWKRVALRQGATLSKARRLERGRQQFQCRFSLPASAPATYSGAGATTEYGVLVHVQVPWWPDRRSHFTLLAAPAPVDVRSTPGVFTTASPSRVGPYVEWSLADTHIRPDKTVRGEIAVGDAAGIDFEAIVVSLVGTQQSRHSQPTEAFRYALTLGAEGLAGGGSVPFRMRAPTNLPATVPTSSRLWSLDWKLEVKLRRGLLASDIVGACPIVVLPDGSKSHGEGQAPPAVGSRRVDAVWDSVADQLDLTLESGVLVGEVGRVRLEIRKEYRRRTAHLVGELAFPSLHLGLDGGPRRGFRRYVEGRREFPIGKNHYATGRELAQVKAFIAPMHRRGLLFTLADMDDENIRIVRRGSGQDPKRLAAFAWSVIQIAQRVEQGRARIPPPAMLQPFEKAWRALAGHLHGELETARMVVTGELDGFQVSVATIWWDADARPEATHVTVWVPKAIAKKYRRHVSRDAGNEVGSASPFSPRAAAIVADIRAETLGLRIESHSLEIVLPAPMKDPAVALPWLDRLIGLGMELRGRGGPYR